MSEHAISNAKGWLESIVELVANLEKAEEGDEIECEACEGTGETDDGECEACNGSGMVDNPHDAAEIEREIHEGPLSLRVRSGWYQPGEEPEPEEFELLLSTGGPALRIVGEIGQHGQPENPRLQWQDWGTPWTDYETTHEEDSALETYCGEFYFGEG